MNSFVNAFRCAIKKDHNELILNFMQETPTIENNGDVSGTEMLSVGSFVMHPSCAKELALAILKMLGKEDGQ